MVQTWQLPRPFLEASFLEVSKHSSGRCKATGYQFKKVSSGNMLCLCYLRQESLPLSQQRTCKSPFAGPRLWPRIEKAVPMLVRRRGMQDLL